MALSKKDKDQLIETERCERQAGQTKIIERLNEQKEVLCRPYKERIAAIDKEMTKAILDAGLFHIHSGCGKTHPDIEKYNMETNDIIRKIIRENETTKNMKNPRKRLSGLEMEP